MDEIKWLEVVINATWSGWMRPPAKATRGMIGLAGGRDGEVLFGRIVSLLLT
ncbi:MAG: hypothetical protein ACLRWQ_21335 [Flavonifractor plautii]